MQPRHFRPSFRAALLALVLAAFAAPPAAAQVRLLTLGINVNCPPGLGECWGKGIREGVAKFDGLAWLSQEADGPTQTAQVRTRDDGLVDLNALARHLEAIQFGATLRGAEAVVDGWLERSADGLELKLFHTGKVIRLAPLTIKTQWDRRKGSAFPATDAERQAHETLLKSASGQPQVVRITGPVRAAANGGWTLEVRAAHRFSGQPPPWPALSAGIRVNSPYGLGGPWTELRECLLNFPGIQQVAERPDNERSTAIIRTRDGRVPDLPALAAHLRATGIGAELAGMEATVEGRLIRQHGQLFLKSNDSAALLPLAPLTRKIQWDHRQRRTVPATSVESEAYARLASRTGSSRALRVTGTLAQTADQRWTLLEVREFDLNPRAAGALAAGRTRDTTPPAAVEALAAIVHADGSILLEWDLNEEPDVTGYNVYRCARPDGRFVKVNRQPVKSGGFDIAASRTATADYYAVTVVDRAGNESVRSAVTDARPPAAPKYLVASAGDDLVSLEWDAVEAADLDSYSVRRAESPGGPYAVITVGVTGHAYTDHGAAGGRTYYYVVTAVDGSSNESAFSNESSAAPARAATTGVSARR